MVIKDRIGLYKFLSTKEFFDNTHHQSSQSISKVTNSINQEVSSTEISDYLVAFSNQWNNYCVGCVDMVNSTKISASISPHKLSVYYEIFLNSISKIIGIFGMNFFDVDNIHLNIFSHVYTFAAVTMVVMVILGIFLAIYFKKRPYV